MIKEYLQYLKDNPEQYWFKAKIYGWGWTPARWQGWLALGIFFVCVILATYAIERWANTPQEVLLGSSLGIMLPALILILVAWKTGENPRWRWEIPKKK